MKLDSSISAIITGGASGLGAATARRLAKEGVKIGIFDLQEEKGEALAKELREEAGIVPVGRPALHGVVRNRTSSERDHVAVYVVRVFSEGPMPRSMEIAEGRFFPLDALPEGITPGTRRRLDEVLAGQPAASDW